MSGRIQEYDFGQLALMDALIFFIAATAISSVVLYYSGLEHHDSIPDHGGGRADPDQVLGAVLHASLGVEEPVGSDGIRHISSDTEIRQCLLTETRLLEQGTSQASFDRLNGQIEVVLQSACGAFFGVQLSVWEVSNSTNVCMLRISCGNATDENVFAAHSELADDSGVKIIARLTLAPTLLPEGI